MSDKDNNETKINKSFGIRKYTSSKFVNLILLILSLLFVQAGIDIVKTGDDFAWILVLFFGVIALGLAVNLLPGASWLELREDGFSFCSLYRVHNLKWSHVTDFGIIKIRYNKFIIFGLSEKYRRPKSIITKIVGNNGSMPTYGQKAENLVDLMKKYKQNSMKLQ